MIYRSEIKDIKGFEESSIGGRKVARVATIEEKRYLIRLHNEAIRLHRARLAIADKLAEIREREDDLYFFIREKGGLL